MSITLSRKKTSISFCAAFLLLALAAPAQAAPPTPALLSPANGAVVASLPAFAWNPSPGAHHYEFQVSADSGFNSPVLGYGNDRFFTGNTRATLKKTIPNGTLWWRVRAATEAGAVSPWSAVRSVKKAWTSAPTLVSPAYDATLTYPASPFKLSWTPTPGAAKYLVTLATDPALGSPVWTPVETAASQFSRAPALAPGRYYWGVTPIDAEGNRGKPSSVGTFTWAWPTTTATSLNDLVSALEVFDPLYSWNALPGAARYEVEVNSSSDFTPGSKVCCSGTTLGTAFASTVLYENNTYYWRIRALDQAGNAGVWNLGPDFAKTFDNVAPVGSVVAPSIKSLHMRDNLTDAGTDVDLVAPGYQTQVPVVAWDPVPGASSYLVDVTYYDDGAGICDWTHSANEHWTSQTAANAWTPLGSGWNSVKPYPDVMGVSTDSNTSLELGHSYCVRVRARTDRDTNGQDIYGDYTDLDWGVPGGPAFTFTDYPTGGACTPSCTNGYLGTGDYVLPAHGTTTGRTPLFTWKPLSGKQSYFVIVSKDAAFNNIADYAFTQIPAYAPRTHTQPSTFSDETTLYYWAVLPAVNFNGGLSTGNPLLSAFRNFQKQSTPPALLSPVGNTQITTQPTFTWTAAEGARRYRLQVSQDPTFGSPIDDVLTRSTAYTSNSTYPADTVLYWRVRADDEKLVGLTWSATGTFRRTLPAPVPDADNPTSGDLIPLFTWAPITGAVSYDFEINEPDGDSSVFEDAYSSAFAFVKMTGTGVWGWRVRANYPTTSTYSLTEGPWSVMRYFTRTIHEPAGATTDRGVSRVLFSWQPVLGMKNYRLQVSSRPDFARLVENVITDNTVYAPRLTTGQEYLNGGLFYWRVAAADEDRNTGDFSPALTLALPKAMRVTTSGSPVKGRRVPITVTVRDAARKPVTRAAVRVSGAGVTAFTRRTNAEGRVVLYVKARRTGRVTFAITKSGYVRAIVRLAVRR
ncbi:MAG TPA: hypothetical protein VNB88_00975 [Gaiellaceae bacterium]|nr:hypothetical protein [Gaiellaceae bacterium]